MKRPLAVVGFSFFLTLIALGKIDKTLVSIAVFCASLAVFAVSMAIRDLRKRATVPTAALCVAAACVLFAATVWHDYYPTLALRGEHRQVEAVIVSLPEMHNDKYRYLLKTKTIDGEEKNVSLRLSVPSKLSAQPYDELSINGTIYVIGSSDKDIMAIQRASGVYLGIYTFSDINITHTHSKSPKCLMLKLREFLMENVTRRLDGAEGKVIVGMLLGETSEIPDDIYNSFKASGVSHLFAVSGLHLSIWSFLAYKLLKRAGCHRRIRSLATILFALFFAFLTGFSLSCMRAAIMLIIVLVGEMISEDADSVNSLGAALLIICIIDPFSACNVGLQLSASAVLGIVTTQPYLYEKLAGERIKNIRFAKPVEYLLGAFTVSISAVIFTLPVSLTELGSLSLVAPLTNVVISFPSYLLMIFGGLTAVSGAVPFINNVLGFVSGMLARFCIFTSKFFASLPFACVYTGEVFIKALIPFSVLVFLAVLLIFHKNKNFVITAVIVSFAVFISGVFTFALIYKNAADIIILDVGGGMSVLVKKNDFCMLVGCSGDYYTASEIKTQLYNEHADDIDVVILQDGADIDALESIADNYDVSCVVCADPSSVSQRLSNITSFATSVKPNTQLCPGVSLSLYENGGTVFADIVTRSGTVRIELGKAGSISAQNAANGIADILVTENPDSASLYRDISGQVIVSSDSLLPDGSVLTTASLGSIRIRDNGAGYKLRRLS